MKFEVCTENLDEIEMISEFPIQSIELCSALEVGGLTPSIGLVKEALLVTKIPVNVLLRPNSGKFTLSARERSVLIYDLKAMADLGISGVVFGFLTSHNEIDFKSAEIVIQEACKLNIKSVFHRAIDVYGYFSKNKQKDMTGVALRLADMGLDGLLTSGGYDKAYEGISIIQSIKISCPTLEIMAGSGINAGNCMDFSQFEKIHFSLRRYCEDLPLNMGAAYDTDLNKLKSILDVYNVI